MGRELGVARVEENEPGAPPFVGDLHGHLITSEGEVLCVPADPVIPVIVGDGVGAETWEVTSAIVERAVAAAFGDARIIHWKTVTTVCTSPAVVPGCAVPDEAVEGVRRYRVAIRGPLSKGVREAFMALDTEIRRRLDLYACVRPVRWLPGVPSPLRDPKGLDIVVIRESTEDVHAGVEWPSGSIGARSTIRFLATKLSTALDPDACIGIKPLTRRATGRLARRAASWAAARGRNRVTIVHMADRMRHTEGAFHEWVREELAGTGVTVSDRNVSSFLRALMWNPSDFDVVIAPNLAGDLISDACSAFAGGPGLAWEANLGDGVALFGTAHGPATSIAGSGVANPGAMLLAAAGMLDHLGWADAASLVRGALEAALRDGIHTADLAPPEDPGSSVGTALFGEAVMERLPQGRRPA